MKIFKLIFLALFIVFSSQIVCNANVCYIHRQVDEGTGDLYWNNSYKCCTPGGRNCVIEPCPNYPQSSIISTITGGWLITANLSSVDLSIKDINNNWYLYQRDGNNYPFQSNEYIIIDNCPSYQGLNGLKINLSGIWTDSNGNYTVFIPSGN